MKSTSERLDMLLEDLKSTNKSSTYTYILLILVVLFFVAIIAFYIKYGYYGRLIFYFLILLVGVLYYRFNILSAIRDLQEASQFEGLKEVNDREYLKQKLNYLNLGIDLKRARISLIRSVYVIMFPVFLVLVSEIYHAPIEGTSHFLWRYLLAFLLGGIFWMFAFNSDLEQMDNYEDDALILARAMK